VALQHAITGTKQLEMKSTVNYSEKVLTLSLPLFLL